MLAWLTAAVIIALNIRLAASAISDWLDAAGPWKPLVWVGLIPVLGGVLRAAALGDL